MKGREYGTIHKEIRNTCKQVKEKLLNKMSAEIGRMSITHKTDMHKKNNRTNMTKNVFGRGGKTQIKCG